MIFFSPSLVSPAGLSSVLTRLQLGIRATRHAHTLVGHNGNTPWYVNTGGLSNSSGSPASLTTLRTRTLMLAVDQGVGLAEGGHEEAKGRHDLKRKEGGGGGAGLVSSISPSSVACFQQCPQLFYYRYVLGERSPATRETLKGNAVHEVLSHFFELPRESRDIEHLHELFRGVMTRLITEDKADPQQGYVKLFESRAQEHKWAVECLDLLANFALLESQTASAEDPCHVEFKMRHAFHGSGTEAAASSSATTSTTTTTAAATDGLTDCTTSVEEGHVPGMTVTGIVDRLDRCLDGKLCVVDYKTGKVPHLKYSEAVNQRIMDEAFFQLQIYALLVERELGEVPGEMRIVYLKGPKSVTRAIGPNDLCAVEDELRSTWDDVASAVRRSSFPPRTSRLCDWCSFKDRCPAFATGVEDSKA